VTRAVVAARAARGQQRGGTAEVPWQWALSLGPTPTASARVAFRRPDGADRSCIAMLGNAGGVL